MPRRNEKPRPKRLNLPEKLYDDLEMLAEKKNLTLSALCVLFLTERVEVEMKGGG